MTDILRVEEEKKVEMTPERKALAKIGAETFQILEDKKYKSQNGASVSIKSSLKKAVDGTILYRPGELLNLNKVSNTGDALPEIEVTDETTSAAGKRLSESFNDVVVLNFASAKNPGGGFLSGAKAQEEDLARKSGLYSCLIEQETYYTANKRCKSCLYTDHLIYSPRVPFFRDENFALLDTPYELSIITSPAPNAGEELQKNPKTEDKIQAVVESRSRDILFAAKTNNHHNLVLGAWGCGIFRNDPKVVAQAFLRHLKHKWFLGAFDHVVFAIYDPYPEKTLSKVFREVFKQV